MKKLKFWFKHVWVASVQLINAILGGYAGETISSRLWRNRTLPKWCVAMKIVDFFFLLGQRTKSYSL